MIAHGNSASSRVFASPVYQFPDVDYPLYDAADDVSDDDNSVDTDDDDASDSSDSDVAADLFASHECYALEHDLLLVKHRCFQPELTLDDVAQRFATEFGLTRTPAQLEQRFETLQAPAFRALFALYLQAIALDNDAHAASGTQSVLPAYQSLLRTTRTSCETRLFQLLYDDEKVHSEPSEMITVEIAGRSFPKYTRSVSKAQLCRCAGALEQLFRPSQSSAPTRTSRHDAFTLHGANTRVERLELTDVVAYYDACHAYNHLESPVFDRFVQFAKDPNVMERLSLLRQQLIESTDIKRATDEQLRAIFDSQHRERLATLEAMRAAECASVQSQLEQVLEADIAHIRRMHTTLVRHERAKIDATFDAHIAQLNERLDAMRDATLALQQTCETSSGWSTLERDILHAELQVERIFGASDTLVRLLILAEDFDAEPVRRAVISYLGAPNRFPQFALRREMTSPMIRDTTVLEIVQRCPTNDLRELEAVGDRFVHHELVTRELHTRRVAFSRLLASLPNDQLRAALLHISTPSSATHTVAHGRGIAADAAGTGDSALLQQLAAAIDFPDVLTDELARRRDFSSVKMNSEHLEQLVSFSDEDCLLQLEAPHRYCTVLATKERKQGESGRWMFEASAACFDVTIEVFSGDGETILLGWEVPRGSAALAADEASSPTAAANGSRSCTPSLLAPAGSNLPTAAAQRARPTNTNSSAHLSTLVPGLSPSADGRSFGVTWQSDSGLDMGILHANGQSRSGVPCFRAGDVVACTIDQDDAVPRLRFYLNGELALPLAASLNTRNSGSAALTQSAGIAVHNPPSRLFPALAMYSSKKTPQMRVRFNFRGGFAFPLPGFEPYGAPLTDA